MAIYAILIGNNINILRLYCFMKSKFSLFVLFLLFMSLIFVSGCTSAPTGNLLSSKCEEIQVPYETQEEYLKTEYYTETVPYTDIECQTKNLVYSITNFVMTSSKCNKQEEVCHKSYPVLGCVDKTVYCVDRTVSCSITINNMDDERGSWTIDFTFFKVGSNSVEKTDSVSEWLYPKTTETVFGAGRIKTKELLETTYTCRYSVSNEPTKQVCRDV
ncbi:MAG: hypothetical protein KAT91_04865, partial [Candidatus Aenigmarchaeota archaeon]|nr:hypothetical protein [Candidatus Aenigmarchaeota archaeon]